MSLDTCAISLTSWFTGHLTVLRIGYVAKVKSICSETNGSKIKSLWLRVNGDDAGNDTLLKGNETGLLQVKASSTRVTMMLLLIGAVQPSLQGSLLKYLWV